MLELAGVAHADVIDEDEADCRGHSSGERCGDGKVCMPETCSRIDYAHRGSNGVPGSTTYACLKCRLGDGGGSSTGMYVGIGVAVVLVGGGIWFARARRA